MKRDKHALQALAERLAGMPRSELERLGLSPATWEALHETSRIKDLRALPRHWKRIANLLEREDMHAVHALMDQAQAQGRAAAAQHHRLERWRERLLDEGDGALGALVAQWPWLDRQQLRALVRAARRDRERGRPEGPRKLFRFLRDAAQPPESDAGTPGDLPGALPDSLPDALPGNRSGDDPDRDQDPPQGAPA